jgi:hypothetical protein
MSACTPIPKTHPINAAPYRRPSNAHLQGERCEFMKYILDGLVKLLKLEFQNYMISKSASSVSQLHIVTNNNNKI